jgi:hypothetical protein
MSLGAGGLAFEVAVLYFVQQLRKVQLSMCTRRHFFSLFFLLASVSVAQQPYRAVLYDGTNASAEQRLMAMTLAGIVNRDSARLYLLNVYETWSYTSTDEHWRDLYRARGNVQFDSIASIITLLDRFRTFINGAITYDPSRFFSNFPGQNFRWQAEYASLIGGLTNRLPATVALAQALNLAIVDSVLLIDTFDGDSAIHVTGRLELPSHSWNATSLTEEQRYLNMLDWGIQKLLPRCNPKKFYLREITDWAVSRKMFQVNLAGTDDLDLYSMPSGRADVLERTLVFLHAKNPATIFHIYGWIRPEPMTQWFAFFGSSFHETLLGNISWHASFPVAPRTFHPRSTVNPDTIPLQSKHYLLFVTSEGDAANWVFGFHAGAWLSPQRGTVPIAWGWNLHLFNECPFVAAYYYDTATANDGFISVTTPLGYAYPDLWQNDVWQGAVDSTRFLKNKFGVHDVYGYKHYAPSGTIVYRGRTISNSFNFTRYGQFQSSTQTAMTLLYDPLVPTQTPFTQFGPLMFNHVGNNPPTFYSDLTNLTAAATRIVSYLRTQAKPSLTLAGYQRFRQDDFANRTSPSSSDVSIPRLAQLVQLITADTVVGRDVEVVTPEKFSVLTRRRAGVLSVQPNAEAPGAFVLEQNSPNPFNPHTRIGFRVTSSERVTLTVTDLLGREVARLVDNRLPQGRYAILFDGSSLPSGVYLYTLHTGRASLTRRMVLVR